MSPPGPMSEPVLTPEFVERGYNNRAAVPDHPKWFVRWAELSAAAKARFRPQLDLRYGPNPKETLDLFLPDGKPRGTFVFIHGGYWRALDKSEHAFVAGPMLAQGIAVANVNYDLCPDVSIATIVDECRRAVTWVVREGARHGAAPDAVVVGGHSAGGHLAAMMAATDWSALGLPRAPLAGAVTLSGVHDLAPMPLFSFNADFKLDADEARRLSPALMRPTTAAPVLCAVGAAETSEFVRQTELLWDAWPDNRPRGSTGPLLIPGRHHFDVVVDFADPGSALTRATLALF
jgi:arylformamidase